MKQTNEFRAMVIAMMLMVCATISLAQTKSHTVTRGETLESIAQKYGVTTEAIQQANPNMGSMFFVGMKLNIPEPQMRPAIEQNSPELLKATDKKEKKSKAKKDKVEEKEEAKEMVQTPLTTEPSAIQQQKPQHAKTEDASAKDQIWHIDYFNSLKSGDKGVYGFGADNLGNSEGIGFSMRMYTNAFLVDSEYFQLVSAFGANYHAKINDIGYFVFPALVSAFGYNEVKFDEKGKKDTKTKLGFGLLVSPYISIGQKIGLAFGPTFSYSFVTEDSSWGAFVGISF